MKKYLITGLAVALLLAGVLYALLRPWHCPVTQAAADQMEKLAFANAYSGYSNEKAIELAEKICRLSYPNLEAVFFMNSGSEAKIRSTCSV